MSSIILQQPLAGATTNIIPDAVTSVTLDFAPGDALLSRDDDALVFSFEDGSNIRLDDFYGKYDSENLPDFVIDGTVVSGADFFAVFAEELQPAAGPGAGAATAGFRSREFAMGTLLDGTDSLGRLDQARAEGFDPQRFIESGGLETGLDGDAAPEANIAPLVDLTASDLNLNVVEAGVEAGGNVATTGTPTAAGRIVALDFNRDDLTYSVEDGEGDYGALTLDDDGNFTYILDNDNTDTNTLNQGESVTETFTVTVSDGRGGTVEQDVTVTITGTNDQPSISVDMAGDTLKEDSDLVSLTGSVQVVDPDGDGDELTEQTLSISQDGKESAAGAAGGDVTLEGVYGNIIIDGETGAYTYTLGVTDAQKEAIDKLADGDAMDETFTVRTTDAHGAYDEQDITITVEGTNDAPRISVEDSVVTLSVTESGVLDGGNTETAGEPIANGKLVVNDVEGQDLTFALAENGSGTYGTFTLHADGTYTYTLDNALDMTQALNTGEAVIEKFTVTVTDSQGGTVSQEVVVNITGTNDQPIISLDNTTMSFTENDAVVTATGTVTVKDVDEDGNELSEQTLTVNGEKAAEGSSIVTVEGQYGNIVLNVATGEYSYTVGVTDAQKATVESLAEGVDYNEDFTVRTTDVHGAFTEQPVNIIITGTNDAPTVKTDDPASLDGGADGLGIGVVEKGVKNVDGDPNEEFLGTPKVEGTLDVNALADDVDQGANLTFVPTTQTGTYGELVLGADGTYSYTIDNTDNDTNALSEGESATETFTVQITDEHGATVDKQVEVTITGTNDKPELTVTPTDSVVKEDTNDNLTATGSIAVKDMDADGNELTEQTLSVSQDGKESAADAAGGDVTLEGVYGNVIIDGDTGEYVYTLGVTDAQKEAVDKLADGDVMDEIFTVRTTDVHGAYDEQDITITVEGTNDVPRISAEDSIVTLDVTESGVLDGGNTETAGEPIANGKLVVNDIEGQALTFALEGDGAGQYGAFTLNPDGTYTYTLDNTLDSTQALNSGEAVTEKFTVTVTDSQGGAVSQEVVVNVTGTNDQPIISLDNTTMAFTENDAVVTATGTVTVKDVDEDGNELSEQTLTINGEKAAEGSETLTVEGQYGNIVLNVSTGEYTYTVGVTDAQKVAVESFAEGLDYAEDFTVRTTDAHGAFTEQPVNITITGTNDAPTVKTDDPASLDGGADGLGIGVVEKGVKDVNGDPNEEFLGIPKVEGSLDVNALASDVDEGASLAFVPTTQTGTYGELVLNEDGTYSYTLDNTDDDTNTLSEGESTTETFTVQITDEHGATVDKQVEVTITGTNDKPELTVTPTDSVVKEDTNDNLTATGSIAVKDVDADGNELTEQTLSVSQDGKESAAGAAGGDVTLEGVYGNVTIDGDTGEYIYTLGVTDAQKEAVDKLANGDVMDEIFTVRTTDAHGAYDEQDITIKVEGTNDVPRISAEDSVVTLDVTESGVLDGGNTKTTGEPVANGKLVVSDVEGQDLTFALAENGSGTYGTFTLKPDGSYTYTLDNTLDSTQALNSGEAVTEKFTVIVTDSQGGAVSQEVVVNVTGTNDQPIISLDNTTMAFTENDAVVTATGTVTISDVDADGNTLVEQTLTINGEKAAEGSETLTVEGQYGSMVLNVTTGEYSYTVGATAAQKEAVEGLADGVDYSEAFTVRTTDAHGAFTEQPVNITITGTNDAPTVKTDDPASLDGGADGLGIGVVEKGVKNVDGDPNEEFLGTPKVEGTLDVNALASDVDEGASLSFVPTTQTGTYGELVLNEDGSYSYTLDNADTDVDTLNAGEKVTDTFTVQVTDEHGVTVDKEVSVTVTGTNDQPELTITPTDSIVKEDSANTTATGSISVKDVDDDGNELAEQTLSVNGVTATKDNDGDSHTITVEGQYGNMELDVTTGEYTYTLGVTDAQKEAVDKLEDNDVMDEIFTVRTTDAHEAYDEQSITIKVQGTNDAPTINTEDSSFDVSLAVKESGVLDGGNTKTDGTPTDSGSVVGADVEGQDLTYTLEGGSSNPKTSATDDQYKDGQYGALILNGDGSITYELRNEWTNTERLSQGEERTETFTVIVTDSQGKSVPQDVTVTVTGTNDQPLISLSKTDLNFSEDDAASSATASASGTVTVTDVDDDGNTLAEQTLTVNGEEAAEGSDTITIEGQYGNMVLDVTTGNYTYTMSVTEAQKTAVEELGKDVQVSEDFVIRTTDAHDAFTEQTVDVTITGTNDKPTLTVTGPVLITGTAVEAGVKDVDGDPNEAFAGTPTLSGDLGSASDFAADKDKDNDDVGDALSFVAKDDYAGTYGTLSLDADGNYTYTLNNDDPDTQALNAGQSVTDTITIQISDGEGGLVDMSVNVNVVGTNDQPIISIVQTDKAVREDSGNKTASGTITVHDEDNDGDQLTEQTLSVQHDGQNVSATEAGGNVTVEGTYGTLVINGETGKYTYTMGTTAEQKAAVDALDTGDKPTEDFTVRTTDAHDAFTQATITVTVNGKNDAPSIDKNSDKSLTVEEAGVVLDSNTDTGLAVSTSTGQLDVTDAEGHDVSYTLQGMTPESDGSYKLDYGTLTLDGKGGYTYTLDNSLAEVNTMNPGDSLDEQFTIVVTDSEGKASTQAITVDIAGTNDRPSIAIAQEDNLVVENSANRMASGIITIADVDTDDNFLTEQTLSISQGSDSESAATKGGDVTLVGEYGTLTINGETGEYLYTLGDTAAQKAAVETLGEGAHTETFTVRTTDPHGAWSEAPLVIDITGKNDGPTLTTPEALVLGTVVEEGVKEVAPEDGGTGDPNAYFKGDNDIAGTLDVKTLATDVDAGDTLSFVGGDFAGKYGTLTLDADGNYTYILNNADGDTQALNEGQSATESIKVQITDDKGAVVTKELQITVEGTNDQPTISVNAVDNEVTEDSADIRATGTISVSDKDADGNTLGEQILSISTQSGDEPAADAQAGADASIDGVYGSLVIDGLTGEYVYTLGTTQAQKDAVNELSEGDKMTETFFVTTTDAHGANDETSVSFTVNGTNDLPVVDAAEFEVGGVVEAGVDAEGKAIGHAMVVGSLAAADDEDDSKSLDVTFSVLDGKTTGTYGTLTLNADGSYEYTLDDSDFHTNSLNAGDKVQDVFQVQVTDTDGGVTIQEFVVNIAGSNDAPELEVAENTVHGVDNNVYENSVDNNVYENSIDKMASGVLQSADVDADGNGIHTQRITVDGQAATAAGEDVTVEGEYGNITFYGDTGAYLYTLGVTDAQKASIAALDDGKSVEESFDVTVTDKHGAQSDVEHVVVNVHTEGAGGSGGGGNTNQPGNEAFVVDMAVEEAGVQKDNGSLDNEGLPLTQGYIVPADKGNVTSLALEDESANGVNTLEGIYGTLKLNPDGTYVYELNNNADATQALSEGEAGKDVFNIVVTYNDGSTKTVPVNVTVTGTNDKPQLSVSHDDGNTLVEDGTTQELTGTIKNADPDSDASQGTFQVDGVKADSGDGSVTVAGTYGTLVIAADGSYTYSLGQTLEQQILLDALQEGESATENFNVRNTDTHGGFDVTPLSFNIEGSNDTPTVSQSQVDLTVTESGAGVAGNTYAQGYIDATDVDSESLSYAFVSGSGNSDGNGTYGTLTLHDDGSFEYRMDEGKANSLAAGESKTDTFTVRVSDGNGGYVDQNVVVTIEGSNDAPVVTTATAPASVTEDDASNSVTTGSIAVSDVDGDTQFTFSVDGQKAPAGSDTVTVEGEYGNIVFNVTDGSYEYTLGVTETQRDALDVYGEGDVTKESFNIVATDSGGASGSHTVNITVNGSNDAPTATAESVLEVAVTESGINAQGGNEAGREQAQGFIVADDIDGDEVSFFLDSDSLGTYGTFTLYPDGSYVYTLNNDDPDTQAIPAGEQVTDTFTVLLKDDNGGETKQDVTVTVTGTNDAPVLDVTQSVLELNFVEGGVDADNDEVASTLSFSGKMVVNDVDGDTLTFSYINTSEVTDNVHASDYGAFTLHPDGSYTFTLDPDAPATQALDAGESVTERFTFLVSDGKGGEFTQSIEIHIEGTNDAPVVNAAQSDVTAAVTEAGFEEVGVAVATGNIVATDAEDHDITVTLAGDGQGHYGVFVVNADGNYTYTLENDAANSLTEGETKTERFTVNVSDGEGGVTQQVITVTVTGSNDAPVVDTMQSTLSGAVTEDGNSIAQGSIVATDAEGDPITVTLDGAPDGVGQGNYGQFVVDAQGNYTYTLDNSLDATQALKDGETKTEKFTVNVSDDEGGVTQQVITVTVTGSNDAPVIGTTSVTSGTVTEAGAGGAGTAIAAGSIAATDVDGDVITFTLDGDAQGTYGSLQLNPDGSYVYTLDNALDATQALTQGETQTEKFTVNVSDGKGSVVPQVVTVTVTGSNDAPVVEVQQSASSLTEGEGVQIINGHIHVDDVDDGIQSLTINGESVNDDGTATVEGTYGTLELAADGTYAYTLGITDEQRTALDALTEDDAPEETFAVEATDLYGTGMKEDISFTIYGGDDDAGTLPEAMPMLMSMGMSSAPPVAPLFSMPDSGDGNTTNSSAPPSGTEAKTELTPDEVKALESIEYGEVINDGNSDGKGGMESVLKGVRNLPTDDDDSSQGNGGGKPTDPIDPTDSHDPMQAGNQSSDGTDTSSAGGASGDNDAGGWNSSVGNGGMGADDGGHHEEAANAAIKLQLETGVS